MFYEIVKDFQSGIVGILGFIGVIITLWWNANVAAVARNDQLHDAEFTLQSALHQELASIRQELVNIRAFASDKSLQSFQFTLEQPYVFHTLVKDIGILQAKKAQTVIRVYRDLYLTMNTVRGLAKDQDKVVATLEAKKFPDAIQSIAYIQDELNEAITALE
jgi:hypothetical protein